MGKTIEHLDSLFTIHVAADTLQVASSQLLRQYTSATNDHRLHPCYVPSQSQASHPSLAAFPPVPFRLRTLKNRLPALCFPQNPDTRFAPKILAMICKQVGIKKGDNLQESFLGKSIRKSSYRLSRANKLTLRQL